MQKMTRSSRQSVLAGEGNLRRVMLTSFMATFA